jgi:hypothetical protein
LFFRTVRVLQDGLFLGNSLLKRGAKFLFLVSQVIELGESRLEPTKLA